MVLPMNKFWSCVRALLPFDHKLDALAKFVHNITINRSKPDPKVVEALFAAGYNEANLVDIIMVIGDKFYLQFYPRGYQYSNRLSACTSIRIECEYNSNQNKYY